MPLRTSELFSLAGKPLAQGLRMSLSWNELQRPFNVFSFCFVCFFGN